MNDIQPQSPQGNTSWITDPLEMICANSFRNFHAKGLDYICLHRSPSLTVKAYFFDGDLKDVPEIVVPHDHRYDFKTKVLSGALTDVQFREGRYGEGEVYQRFSYDTPLNGGKGFDWEGETRLRVSRRRPMGRGSTLFSPFDAIHTLCIDAPDTVALLYQYDDMLPVGVPTTSYRLGLGHDKPSLDGLYDEMTPDHARYRLAIIEHLFARRA